MTKDIAITRSVVTNQANPIDWSLDSKITVVIANQPFFYIIDNSFKPNKVLINNLENSLINIVGYNESLQITQTSVENNVQLASWNFKCQLGLLLNNLNLFIANNRFIVNNDDFINVNNFLKNYYKIDCSLIIKNCDLLKLRIHSFSWSKDLLSSKLEVPLYLSIATEDGSIVILQSNSTGQLTVNSIFKTPNGWANALSWSPWSYNDKTKDYVSYLLIILKDNSTYLKKIILKETIIVDGDLIQLKAESNFSISNFKWSCIGNKSILSVVSTNLLQVFTIDNNSNNVTENEIKLGSFYSISNILHIKSDKNLIIVMTNSFNLLFVFRYAINKPSLILKYMVNYNNLKELEKIQDEEIILRYFIKKLIRVLKINSNSNLISIRGLSIDGLNNLLAFSYVLNDKLVPSDLKAPLNLSFKTCVLPIFNHIDFTDEVKLSKFFYNIIEEYNFFKVNPMLLLKEIEVFCDSKKIDDQLLVQKLSDRFNDDLKLTFSDVRLDKNSLSNSLHINLIQLNDKAIQKLQIASSLFKDNDSLIKNDFFKNPDFKILRLIITVVIAFVNNSTNKKKLITTPLDEALYESYNYFLNPNENNISKEMMIKQENNGGSEGKVISITNKDLKITEVFNLESLNLHSIQSLNNNILWKRCCLTLLPIMDTGSITCGNCSKTCINIKNLCNYSIDENSSLTREILNFFHSWCAFCGNRLNQN
ncbi:hypothetical protein PACTADRAFT_33570 [Pachysolen tannophilus NRRL Y-2460]|uniref:Transcription factor IIIC putative zinc-finger domain-containing protein n=1 Tax=Pachysolen tannophilus NRRL Y-2460 TaxID=669874 RepID=A0A1E4TXC4_PACTA|nr:hypothetical protein PACTADRAFT_33570 [Pachysolen tannophilus NRRL Y-2460]